VENVFDAMIAMQLDGGEPAAAFATLERGRLTAWGAASGRTPAGRGTSPAGTLSDIGARLPGDMLLVQYALLRDRLVVWTVSGRGWRQDALPITRDSVAGLVDRLVGELDEPEVRASDARARLFDLLLRPIGRDLRGIRRIAVVPDRELHRVPFVALWDSTTRRYAVEQQQFRTVPSAAFLLATPLDGRLVTRGARVLVVGDPTPGLDAGVELAPLPSAVREAQSVAAVHPRVTLLLGAAARRAAVLAGLSDAEIVHFAGHAVFNSDRPELSYLALTPDTTGADGSLRAREIAELRLPKLRIVVLSACSTLNPRPTRTGAIAGLASTFLRAGAPATISTLWDVADPVVTDLLIDFHERIADDVPAAEALRQAQRRALSSPHRALRAPRAWAAFTYTGA
jgi:CHAT domain-containing protein